MDKIQLTEMFIGNGIFYIWLSDLWYKRGSIFEPVKREKVTNIEYK